MNGLFMDSCLTLVELLKEVLCVRYILDYKYKKVLNGWRLIALPLIILTECASSMATIVAQLSRQKSEIFIMN